MIDKVGLSRYIYMSYYLFYFPEILPPAEWIFLREKFFKWGRGRGGRGGPWWCKKVPLSSTWQSTTTCLLARFENRANSELFIPGQNSGPSLLSKIFYRLIMVISLGPIIASFTIAQSRALYIHNKRKFFWQMF